MRFIGSAHPEPRSDDVSKEKKQRDCEMEMRVKLLKAHHNFLAAMQNLAPEMNNILETSNQFLYSRVAPILRAATEAAEFLGMNIDNDF